MTALRAGPFELFTGLGFCRHYTGKLVPLNQFPVSHYGAPNTIDFVPDPVSAASFITDPINTGFNADLRVFLGATIAAGPGQSAPAAPTFAIDTWLTGQSDPGSFTSWPSAGYVNMRYLRAKLSAAPTAGSVGVISDFVPTIDTAPTVETGSSVVIAGGGTPVTFPEQFHVPPQVVANCISNTALTVTVASVTATGCAFHVWNSSGADVGGTINYEAIGE